MTPLDTACAPANTVEAPDDVDNVLPTAADWLDAGESVVLVTLVGIDGSSPRPLGAQMAVTGSGQACGFISNGCLEREIIDRAHRVLARGENECVRYGKGSPYIDIVLPCGSGLDLYFDQSMDPALIRQARDRLQQRQPVAIETDLDRGHSRLTTVGGSSPSDVSRSDGRTFVRHYPPALRLLLCGEGPALRACARLAHTSGFEVQVHTPEAASLAALARDGLPVIRMRHRGDPVELKTDAWTAAVVLFHDHDGEPELLARLLDSPVFYIGAQGSQRTHASRVEALRLAGFDDRDIVRIHGPMGLIPRSKNPTTLAVSTLAEVLHHAQQRGYPC
ncbi:XdhC family protein [Saccharospirillum salsuginis]|uniref:Xanthine dehydrogenase accessory factor n=1 Tax=Saccharospirillum salsuginis TaxID=418750 RepID=A0A918N9V5_9GAMM|nr:XdhC family protein [Saccharospirillum salsuginis]GGX57242.1 hypothetical protein GCM10007392_25970 [Saccharospirillum salsuginis]